VQLRPTGILKLKLGNKTKNGFVWQNRSARSFPVREFHRQRRGYRLAPPHPLPAFKLRRRPVHLPLDHIDIR
jgi:hypothetical protein